MANPFSVPDYFADPLRRGLLALARPAIERSLALSTLGRMYAALPGREDGRHFCEKALEALRVRWEVPAADLARIPASGPLVVVANHPFGGLDGLVLTGLLLRVRPDVKLIGNHLLRRIPDLRDTFLYVDAFGGEGSASRNASAVRAALRWVRRGGALAIFPAGEVSHARLPRLGVSDPPWGEAIGRLVLAARAPVLTVFFAGQNSLLFQAAGWVHPRLRTALLPRELLRRRGGTVRARVGSLIEPARLEGLGGAGQVAAYLRVRTYILKGAAGSRGEAGRPRPRPGASGGPSAAVPVGAPEPIAAPPPAADLAREVDSLPAVSRLLESGPYRVLCARAASVPSLLHEIGRLREIAFRQVGEGTGRALDLDRFDEEYLHLILWNQDRSEVVGAYRMGPTDEIVPRHGTDGLYTSTLFRFDGALLDQIGPALEMGRSFVRPEYQKTHSALTLLWKGIGRFVVAHPRYRRLFGPVSISAEYESMSRQLLMSFLRMNRYMADLGRLIRPKNPPRFARARDWDERQAGTVVRDLDDVDILIREIESDRRSMPILLRQYLRLNGMLLGFNVDPSFGDVLDGLILVDLVKVEPAILARYMGSDGLRAFLAFHAAQSERAGDGRSL